MVEGRPTKLIADELDISVRTVEVHRARVFEDGRALGGRVGQPLEGNPGGDNACMALGEFDLIASISPPVRQAALGVGDDCALLVRHAGHWLAVSTDMLVEGRHFLSTVAPGRLGHKALAVT